MAKFEVIMPKMGESIEEATITKWFVKEGDKVVEDDILLEIATDKVDSEIPSPVEGVIQKIMYQQDETVAVGSVIAVINLDGESGENGDDKESEDSGDGKESKESGKSTEKTGKEEINVTESTTESTTESKPVTSRETSNEKALLANSDGKFFSPLVRNIASEEGISQDELLTIPGSGQNGRVQKNDILNFIKDRKTSDLSEKPKPEKVKEDAEKVKTGDPAPEKPKVSVSLSAGDEIIEMDRMRKLIAEHMVYSKKVSAHVTNMLEADVTEVVNWRNTIKDDFFKREGIKLTYLPVFFEAAIKAIKDFPLINSSVDGTSIIIKKRINLGFAVSLPNNSLIVPVIKDADNYNLAGLTKELNRLADDARNNKLKPDDIQGGTFTITNFGTFRNTIGTPIINQPQVAILAIGVIEKKPAVLETKHGDVIAIRHKMFLSLTYDHRIIDGSLGGSYLRKVADYIEDFNPSRSV